MHFADGLTLRTHLRMTGSWHLYRERERWQKPAYLARVVVGTDSGWVAVCFQAPVVETYRRGGARARRCCSASGPTCAWSSRSTPTVLDEVVERAGRLGDPAATLGEALLDQRIAAGIGNVYKSEACFACRLDPTAPLAAVDDDARRRVWAMAARQLQANLDRPGRQTHPQGLAVYGRGRPALPGLRHARSGSPATATSTAAPTGARAASPPSLVKIFTSGRYPGGVAVVPKVVVVGAGFGGIEVARHLADRPVDLTLVDRNNFHTFQPLLYQVATAGLNAADVAHVVRGLFQGQRNLRFRQATVTGVDWADHHGAARRTSPRCRSTTWCWPGAPPSPTSARRAPPSTASPSTRSPTP